jgi:hypothetical protein
VRWRCLEQDGWVRNPFEELEKRRAHGRTFSTAALSGGEGNGDDVAVRLPFVPARWSASGEVDKQSSWRQQLARRVAGEGRHRRPFHGEERRRHRLCFEAAPSGGRCLETKPVIGEEKVRLQAALQWLARGLPSGWSGGSRSRAKSRSAQAGRDGERGENLLGFSFSPRAARIGAAQKPWALSGTGGRWSGGTTTVTSAVGMRCLARARGRKLASGPSEPHGSVGLLPRRAVLLHGPGPVTLFNVFSNIQIAFPLCNSNSTPLVQNCSNFAKG